MKYLLLALALVLVAGCVSQGLDCKEPFVKIGEVCCLDRNANSICDFYEGTSTTSATTTTVRTTTTTTTTAAAEALAISGFKALCEDDGDVWCEVDDNEFTIYVEKARGLNEFAEFYATVSAGEKLTDLKVTHDCDQTSPSAALDVYFHDGVSWRGVKLDTWFDCYKCQTKTCDCDVYPNGEEVTLFPAGETLKYYIEFDPRNSIIGTEDYDVTCVFKFKSDQKTVEKTFVFEFK